MGKSLLLLGSCSSLLKMQNLHQEYGCMEATVQITQLLTKRQVMSLRYIILLLGFSEKNHPPQPPPKGINWIIKRASDLLSVPLMTLVDFHGQRLSAQSLVPIGDGDNLIYGSANAGATIKTAQDHPHHARAIQEAANRFHLAPHRIADAYRVEHIISFPVDIEIHQVKRSLNLPLSLSLSIFPSRVWIQTCCFAWIRHD